MQYKHTKITNFLTKIIITINIFLLTSFLFLYFSIDALALTEHEAKNKLLKDMWTNPTNTYMLIVKSDSEESKSTDIMYESMYVDKDINPLFTGEYFSKELYYSYDRNKDFIIRQNNKPYIHIIIYTAREKNDEFNYIITIEEEQQLNKQIKEKIKELNLDGLSDKDKVTKIYKFITENFVYDYTYSDEAFDAFHTWQNETGVCQAFAMIFQKLCIEANIPCQLQTGGLGVDRHMWNIAQIDNYWYYFDPTWDLGKTQNEWEYFMQINFDTHTFDEEYQSINYLNNHKIKKEGN